MSDLIEKLARNKKVTLLANDAERCQLIDGHPEAFVVSETLPLRANLSVLENISVVLQFRTNAYVDEANDSAWELLAQVGHAGCAEHRDPDLTHEQRFVAKLLRAVVMTPPLILIDRPALLLPDTNYPFFVNKVLAALEDRFEQCWILDYVWNAALYNSRA